MSCTFFNSYYYLDGIRQSKKLKDVTEDEFKIQTNNFLRHAPARFIAKSGKN